MRVTWTGALARALNEAAFSRAPLRRRDPPASREALGVTAREVALEDPQEVVWVEQFADEMVELGALISRDALRFYGHLLISANRGRAPASVAREAIDTLVPEARRDPQLF
ncbi:hypothetical protein [Caldimonas sp. KR1-144]|uniref:hypothetical protein n=1 Tax=Caldimonas sp. KR1-144 TaxID=3400911 RepID=UPI003C0E0FE5